ncbi:sugar phosphate isomerase/epimerase family protein [Protaetiibacter larvae]|uniref:Sugar phosphate isomerase/epimerase n=1 Tax=Protaetiibacter larvae TaxID=2592654 RepID=A0A5C1Y8A9_9MICO|nr:TIM barrel protein [Protaetiibacter larvae]QEO09409.1 sugar phosphate isomerase/epimerase [Protaetiibacter larvae]
MSGTDEIELGEVTGGAYSSADWPIAAGMLQFAGINRDGGPILEAPPAQWRSILSPVAYEGFTALELGNRWFDLTLAGEESRSALREVLDELGLDVPGYIVAGRPITDAARTAENLRYTHESIDAAAAFGARVLCIGLHPFSARRPGAPLWFWTEQDNVYDDDPAIYAELVSMLRELGRHSADVGIELSVELYPGTAVGTAARAVQLISDIDLPSVGLNPDLGNYVRVQGPIEDWQDVVVATLPLANYWHVKNYSRTEDPFAGTATTVPSGLDVGVVDYRKALRFALARGFSGTIVTEHYGGDGIAVSAANRDYLRRLLAAILEEPLPRA